MNSEGPGMSPAAAQQSLAAGSRHVYSLDPLFRPHADWAFERQELLGAGGMGQVHRVLDLRTRREAALKLLLEPKPHLIERFVREARVTALLDHPAIPPVYEYGRGARCGFYILMKLVRGQTLDTKIRRFRERCEPGKPPREALADLLRVLLRVCEALAYAHGAGVIHRDVKPSNVMVGRHGKTYLMDWGIARNLEESPDSDRKLRLLESQISGSVFENKLSVQGAVIGSPGYISPEQAAAEEVSAASDIYALGAILFEIICGQTPIAATGTAGFVAAVEGRLNVPRDFGSGYPEVLSDLALRCLKKDPKERPEDINEVAAALREGIRLLGGRGPATRAVLLLAWGLAILGFGAAAFLGLRLNQSAEELALSQEKLALAREELKRRSDRSEVPEAARKREVEGLIARIRLLNDLERSGQALVLADELEKLAPGNVDLPALRGRAHLQRRDFDEAIACYDAYFKRARAAGRAEDAGAYNNRGSAYNGRANRIGEDRNDEKIPPEALADYQRAIADYQKALALNAEQPRAQANLGDVYNNLGQYRKALAAYDEALRIDAEDASAHANKSLAHFFLDELEQARDSANRALSLDPKQSTALTIKAEAERKLAERDQR